MPEAKLIMIQSVSEDTYVDVNDDVFWAVNPSRELQTIKKAHCIIETNSNSENLTFIKQKKDYHICRWLMLGK